MSKKTFNQALEEIYKENLNIVSRIKYRKSSYNYYDSTNSILTDFIVVCPVCGYLKSNISQHVRNSHSLNKKDFYDKYPTYKLVSVEFDKRVRKSWKLTKNGAKSLSDRMKTNNPCSNIETREKISETRKNRFKNDKEFRDKMSKIRENTLNNKIIHTKDRFKVPGWGVGGHYRNFYFRSTNELKALIYFYKNNMLDKVESNFRISKGPDLYYCDFKIDDLLIEIKDKDYAQDNREIKQFKLLKHGKRLGYNIKIWTSKSDEIKSISYFDILREFKANQIEFAQNKEHYSLVKKLKNESRRN